jgi:hypothetical protein
MSAAAIGLLARNWGALNAQVPAIIVNPAASPLDVLAWCWGEVESLHQAARVFENMDSEAVSAIFLHRLAPLSAVFCDALQTIVRERMLAGADALQGGDQ